MSMITTIQAFGSTVLAISACITGLLFAEVAEAEVPLIDSVAIEHIETATFALG